MDGTIEKLVGVKQVLMPEFKAAEAAGATKGYMWFVRDKNISLHNYIYLGSRLYGEAEIDIPIDSLITNITSDNSIIVTKTSTEDGSTVELKVNVDPEGGIVLSENGLQIDVTKFAQQSELLQVKSDIAIVNTNLVTAVNAINQNMADGFNTINGGINDEIRPAIEELKDSDTKSVKYQEFDTNRKTIQLNNYDNISGIMTDGEGVNLAMVSKWDKADFGSTKLPFNMNGSEERPTYNDIKEVALLDDVDSKVLSESERVNAMVNVINDSIKTVNDNLVTAVNTINGGIDNEIRPAIEELKENKVSYVETEKGGVKYRVIQLDNHANLVGEGADDLHGQTFNIGMVSKWNKVDLGSSSLEINLNGKSDRPTYNDTKEIALLEDAESKISSVELIQDVDNQLHYVLMVDNVKKGDINIPKDQFLKDVSYDDTTKELIFVFDTQEGEKTTKIDISGLIDTYEAGNGIELTTNVFSIKLDPSSQSYIQVSVDGVKIIGIDEAINDINTKISDETTRAEEAETKLSTDIKTVEDGYKAADAQLRTDVTNVVDALNVSIDKKVDKQDGKGLSTNDFTDADKVKLDGLDNYDDSEIISKISANTTAIETNKNSITSNTTAIEAEVIRAEAAEKVLTDNLNAEVTRSTDADKVNSNAIAAEETRAKGEEARIEGLLTNSKSEITSNTEAIATNKTTIESEVTRATTEEARIEGLVNTNKTSIESEITRAKAAEQANATAISTEITRATNAEQANTDAITALDTKVSANTTAIATKVDKETGKGLSTNDFTTAEKNKLAGLQDYDDTAIKNSISENTTAISDVDGKADANASEINDLKSTVDNHTASISELRSDLTSGTTGMLSSINKLTTDLSTETTTARNAEKRIDTKVDNIINNGPILPNGKSISARPTGSTDAPVDILTLTSDNKVEVGSNIGQLILKSAGIPVLGVVDGQPKELALKEQINTLQDALNALTARVTALETPNP